MLHEVLAQLLATDQAPGEAVAVLGQALPEARAWLATAAIARGGAANWERFLSDQFHPPPALDEALATLVNCHCDDFLAVGEGGSNEWPLVCALRFAPPSRRVASQFLRALAHVLRTTRSERRALFCVKQMYAFADFFGRVPNGDAEAALLEVISEGKFSAKVVEFAISATMLMQVAEFGPLEEAIAKYEARVKEHDE